MDLLDGLNSDQFHAVITRSHSVLVLAGAGSGKTKTLTSRIAYLIQERGVSPYNVLALTFTRKAAHELKDRLGSILDKGTAKKIWIGTFHSISLRILEQHGSKLGYSRNISVYDEIDQQDIIEAVIRDLGSKLKAKEVLSAFHKYSADADGYIFDPSIASIITEYRHRLKAYNAVDFSLLLTETLELMRRFPEVYEYYHDKYQHVFIDEYQDVDRTQYCLHEAIKPLNIFVVGDHDQSIYGFRGSDIQIVLDFEKNHEDAEIIKLEKSYRCPANVVAAANSLISNNSQRYDKTLWTDKDDGTVESQRLLTPTAEAESIAFTIGAAIQNSDYKYSDMAIITRTHAQHRELATELERAEIPVKQIGRELDYWKSTAARVVISFLQILHNPKNEYHFKRIAQSFIYKMRDSEWIEWEAKSLKSGARMIKIMMDKIESPLNNLFEYYENNIAEPMHVIVTDVGGHIILESGH